MAVEWGRTWCVRHGHLRFARLFIGSNGRAAMLNRDLRARRQQPTQVKIRHSLMRRQEARFDKEGGGGLSVDERGRDELNSPCVTK